MTPDERFDRPRRARAAARDVDHPVDLGTGLGGGRILPFRRPDHPLHPSERHRTWRLLRPFLLALAIVAVPVGLVLWVTHGAAFDLRDLVFETPIETPGGTADEDARINRQWVHRVLRPYFGRNLPRLPLAAVDRRLRQHPWVASADLRKELPGRLHVRIVERQAVALLRHGDGLEYLDASGRVIAPFDQREGTDLLLLSSAIPPREEGEEASMPRPELLARALEMRDEVYAAGPAWAAGLSEIEILGEEDFRLWSADLAFPLLVRSGNVRSKVGFLNELLPQVERRYEKIAAVDLRFARRIILKPAVPDRTQSGRTAAGRS